MANGKVEIGFDRRKFLKTAGFAGVGLAGFFAGPLSGWATTESSKQDIIASLAAIKPEPVVYPKLPYNKVQAPENGCLIGFRRVYAKSMPDAYKKEWMSNTRASESVDDIVSKFNDPTWDTTISKVIGGHIDYYEKALGKKPAVFVMYETPKLFLDFTTKQAEQVTVRKAIPYLYFLPHWEHKTSIRLDLKDIANGKHDKLLTRLAQGAAEFGKQNGGNFVTTMEESNADWYYWGLSSNFTQQVHKNFLKYCLGPCRQRGKSIISMVTGPHRRCPLPPHPNPPPRRGEGRVGVMRADIFMQRLGLYQHGAISGKYSKTKEQTNTQHGYGKHIARKGLVQEQ